MQPKRTHPWDLTPEQAEDLQHEWAEGVIQQDQLPGRVRTIAGVDIHYLEGDRRLVAGVAVLDAETLTPLETTVAHGEVSFPYVPGLFSFRELPTIVAALGKLTTPPDLIICDGQGLAHFRRFGLACHLGVMFELPTLGCAKKRLIGEHDEPGDQRGDHADLMDRGETIGSVLRTQSQVKPVYVSVGHKISLETARAWVLKAASQYRLPETTRAADHLVRSAPLP